MRSIVCTLAVCLLMGLVPSSAWGEPPVPKELLGLSVPQPPPPSSSAEPPAKKTETSGLYSPQVAEFLGATENTWVSAAPYAWVFSLSGNIGVRGAQLPVDQPFPDKIDELDRGAAALGLHVEGGMGNVGLIFDGMMFDETPGTGFVHVQTDSTIIELLGFYRLFCAATKQPKFSNVTVDVLAGVRYYDVTNTMSIPFVLPLAVERADSWCDLVFGARVSVQIHEGLVAFARADCGGFSLNHSSRRAVNLLAGVEYACPWVPGSSFVGDYRIFQIDQRSGSGINGFVYDVTLSGPFVAFKVGF